MNQQLQLTWNNHTNNMIDFLKKYLSSESMVDVTLACDGLSLKAHKLVLAACSPFFQSLLLENSCKHPIVILKDIKYTDLKSIVEFMYFGEVKVAEDQLPELMKTAEILQVKGFYELTNENHFNQHDVSPSPVSRTNIPFPNQETKQTRKRSSSESAEASEPKIRQSESPKLEKLLKIKEEFSPKTEDINSNDSSVHSSVPMQVLTQSNCFHESSQQEQSFDQIATKNYAIKEKYAVESSKVLEPTTKSLEISVQPNGEKQNQSLSNQDNSFTNLVSASNDIINYPESLPDFKPKGFNPPLSPVPGCSYSEHDSFMINMDQLSVLKHDNYQNDSALVLSNSQSPVLSSNSCAKTSCNTVIQNNLVLPSQPSASSLPTVSSSEPDTSSRSNDTLVFVERSGSEETTENGLERGKSDTLVFVNTRANNKASYECDFCFNVFASKNILAYHKESHQGSSNTASICPICSYSTSDLSEYNKHMITHIKGSKEKEKINCDKKSKKNKQKNKKDETISSPVKSYECNICFKIFKDECSFNVHQSYNHSKVKRYKCECCKYTTAYTSMLRKHMKEIHPKRYMKMGCKILY